MTRAEIQALIDARGEITLPHTGHYLDGPLIMRDGAHLSLAGGTLVKWFDGDGPLVQAATPWWSLRNGALQDGGIALADGASFFTLDNLYITHAACAYTATGGVWMGTLARVWAKTCVDGFRQVGGTTMTFDHCFANACTGRAWHLENVYGASLRACAADHNRDQAVRFYACQALSISSWYMEANLVNACTFLLVDACQGDIAGMVSLGNILAADTGQGAYLVQINAGRLHGRGLALGGAPKRDPDRVGGPGLSQTLLVSGGATVVLSACELYHADKDAGAGPASALVGTFVDGGGNAIGGIA